MKISSGPKSVRLHLNRFAIAAMLVGVGLLALAWPAEAEIVYTPVKVTILGNGSITLDLNNDGVTDFTISAYYGQCFDLHLYWGAVDETPAPNNGVIVDPLAEGDQIGPSETYNGSKLQLAYESAPRVVVCGPPGHSGSWWGKSGYLGLMFQIDGGTYYGWARLSVDQGPRFTVKLTGYAYETIRGMPIDAGQTTEAYFKITASPTSATVSPGQSTTSTLTLTPVFGFSGTVALTCKVPSGKGLSCEVSPSSVTLDGTNPATTTLSINTSSSTSAGTYKINARGNSGTIAHGTTFTLTVQ